MSHTYSAMTVHIVFSTKNRAPIIDPSIEDELYLYLSGIIESRGAVLYKIGGIEDHIHIVIRIKPTLSIPELLRYIKTSSAKWVNDHHKIKGHFNWQIGYGIFTVSESQLDRVIAYVNNQKKHHHHKTYKTEFVQLLKKHNVDYDPQYIWD